MSSWCEACGTPCWSRGRPAYCSRECFRITRSMTMTSPKAADPARAGEAEVNAKFESYHSHWKDTRAMTPDAYQQLAGRTVCPQEAAMTRLAAAGPGAFQLLHSVVGMMGELGEICSLLQKVYWYGKDMPPEEFVKQLGLEFGDVLWYHSEGLSAVKKQLSEIMEQNINKLRVRYPGKYTDWHAAEENRDREKEERATPEAPKPTGCHYCARPAVHTLQWFKGPFGRPGPVSVPYCGECSLKDALASRGMTAPAAEGKDYRIIQDGHGFGHMGPADSEGGAD